MPKKFKLLYLAITVLVILVAILAYELISIVATYKSLRQHGFADFGRLGELRHFPHHRLLGPPSVQEVDNIRPWMTFSYINSIFGLPENHLKDMLHITNPNYPNITIRMALRPQSTNSSTFMDDLKAAVRTYLTQHPPTSSL